MEGLMESPYRFVRCGSAAILAVAFAAAFTAAAASAVSLASVKSISIFQGRRISTSVPEGWSFSDTVDKRNGVQTIEIRDPAGEIELSVSFFPDTEGRLSTKAAIEAEIRKDTDFYLSGSVEREIAIVPLGSSKDLGAFAVFTDRNLVGKAIPSTERLYSTVGIRSWDGAFLLFTLLSNSRDAERYRTALDIVRTGIVEVPKSK
jgi:hypothetical protein